MYNVYTAKKEAIKINEAFNFQKLFKLKPKNLSIYI